MSRKPLLATALVVALLPHAAPARVGEIVGAAQRPAIAFADQGRRGLLITAPGYRLRLSPTGGGIVELVDRTAGARVLLPSQPSCLWTAEPAGDAGCSYRRAGPDRFAYRWNAQTSTLTLTYDGDDGAARRIEAVASIRADASSFDLRLRLENRWGEVIDAVSLPAGLTAGVAAVEAGYAPNVLPGVRLGPGFFARTAANVYPYPGRWAFADYLALDVDGGRLALATVNPAPEPIRPVKLGFVHADPPGRCSGARFCIRHDFQTWIRDGEAWLSPVVRVHVGRPVEETIRAYRVDNGIDRYPSLAAKLGPRLDVLGRAPLVKLDAWKAGRAFGEWGETFRTLPSPALLHPVAYMPRGHDENSPDFLPPDPRFGTSADFRAAIELARSLGHLVMPYLNVSWWDDESPTLERTRPKEVSVQDARGEPVIERYHDRVGYLVSPHAPYVRERVAGVMGDWRAEVPADCLFFDQIGARDWRRDFNPASPTREAYYDGWLELMAPFADRCLMAEDGWDRLAGPFVAFHGSLLMMSREHGLPDTWWGKGNWSPYPLATWLLHDKVLLYQHDLYDGTLAVDGEVLTWNLAWGLVNSWEAWTRPLDDPWLQLAATLQRTLGPHYAGKELTGYRELAPGVTETTFGELVVVANWDAERTHQGIAPKGFAATAPGVTAGIFEGERDGVTLSPGPHHLVVERGAAEVIVRQPIGADTTLAVPPPAFWRLGQELVATALDAHGRPLGLVDGELRDGRFLFRYARTVDTGPVAAYRIGTS